MTPEELKAVRTRWGMSQQAFSASLGISSRERVSDMERGTRKIPRTLAMLIKMTEKTIQYLEEAGDA